MEKSPTSVTTTSVSLMSGVHDGGNVIDGRSEQTHQGQGPQQPRIHYEDNISILTDDKATVGVVTKAGQGIRDVAREMISQSIALFRGDESENNNGDINASSSMLQTIDSADEQFHDAEEELETEDRRKEFIMKRKSRLSLRASLPAIDFLKDDYKNMTYGRRIARSLIRNKKKWYYNPEKKSNGDESNEQEEGEGEESGPLGQSGKIENDDIASLSFYEQDKNEVPNLEKAWAYFEHVTLPRYMISEAQERRKKKGCCKCFLGSDYDLDRAEPGEDRKPTRLYDPIFTPLNQMGDFGLGLGLYFATLRATTIMTLIAALIQIPNMMYFSGEEYSDNQDDLPTLLKGSAICTREIWVPCADCTLADFDGEEANADLVRARFATAEDLTTNSILTFAKRNDCDGATLKQGMYNYATLWFIIIAIIFISRWQIRKEVHFDEDEQTAQDYSIMITNPPPDATDPQEWKIYFEQKYDATVTVCTIAVDNDLLVQSLVKRREVIKQMRLLLEPGESLDVLNLAMLAAAEERERNVFQRFFALFSSGVPEFFGELVVLNAKIQGLAQLDYPAKKIFITFETESAQRKVLSVLSVGSMQTATNDKSSYENKEQLFRAGTEDERVLQAFEADEPSTIRWQDLNTKLKSRMKQIATTMIITLIAILLAATLVVICQNANIVLGSFAISVSNAAFPMIAKVLTDFESHSSEGGKQTSLYIKIAVFRWVITAMIITIITPFTSTLTEGPSHLIQKVYTIFFAEIITVNVLQLLDIGGQIQRHIFAPRAKTQERMNLCMLGAEYELAEKYTNMTKILFLALWYCSIYPATLFMCSFTLFVNFFVDRFSLMRSWKRAPRLGTRIASFSRKYFFSMVIVSMSVISSYYWSGFPYDNICITESTAGSKYAGTWTLKDGNNKTLDGEFTFHETDSDFRYCLQDYFRMKKRTFPALSIWQPSDNKWMSTDQETVVDIFGVTSAVILCVVCLFFALMISIQIIRYIRGGQVSVGDDQGIPFSMVEGISSYVPEVQSNFFAYPLLACRVDDVDEELFEWTDSDRHRSYYDLTRDADELLKGHDATKDATKNVFSKVSHWPPLEEESEDST